MEVSPCSLCVSAKKPIEESSRKLDEALSVIWKESLVEQLEHDLEHEGKISNFEIFKLLPVEGFSRPKD